MGKLTLTLPVRPEATRGRDHILTRLRRCGARLVGSTVAGIGDAAAEVFEFATKGARKRKRRARPTIGALADQQARLARLEAVARMSIALSDQPFPLHPTKEESVRKVSARTLVLGKHEAEARQIYALAKRLVRGEGPPEDVRMPRPAVTIVPCGSDDARDVWGVGGVGVAIEMRRPYPPIEAMVVAGYILLGLDWPERYRTLRLPAALDAAYAALERHFEAPAVPEPAALVTIPKAVRSATPTTRRPAELLNGPPEAVALPSPTRQQLPPPTDAELSSTEGDAS